MRRKLMLALAIATMVGAMAAIAFALGARSSGGSAAPVVAVAGGETPGGLVAPAVSVRADTPADDETEIVRSGADQPGGPSEGIKVHGRWTIEVTEADGRFVSLTEFDNALESVGATSLSRFLARDSAVGVWLVSLHGPAGGVGPCILNNGGTSNCGISELPASNSVVSLSTSTFGDMLVTAPASGPNANALVLSGSATIANDTTIARVTSRVRRCDATVAPADAPTDSSCLASPLSFTSKNLNVAVPVLVDQVVNVTVVISFS